MTNINSKPIVIGIDHGFSMMKYAHGEFPNGLIKLSTDAALKSNTLGYEGCIYKIGEGRLALKDDKVSDEDYFVLTVATICKELEARGLRSADVIIAAGLPFSRFGAERDDFKAYLMRDDLIRAKLDGIDYEFTIKGVDIFPQCYAAMCRNLESMESEALAIDIGSKTIDILHIVNKVPVESESTSIPGALIECIEHIKNEVYRQTNRKVSETQVQTVILGADPHIPDECLRIIKSELHAFTQMIEAKIRELGFDPEMIAIYYVGGGACVMRRFKSGARKNVTYIEDIRANALGYEQLAIKRLNRRCS